MKRPVPGPLGLALLLSALGTSCAPEAPLRLAFLGGLTGRNSYLGLAGRNGAELAVADLNARRGWGLPRYILEVYDTRNEAAVSRAQVPLIAEQGAKLIIGPMVSAEMEGLIPTAQKHRLVLLSPTVSAETYSGQRDLFFRLMSSTRYQAEALADHAWSRGWRRLAVVKDSSNLIYTQSVVEALADTWSKFGGELLRLDPYHSGQGLSFENLTGQLAELKPEALVLIGSGPDLALFSQTQRRQGLRLPVLSSQWGMSPELLSQGAEEAEGLLLSGLHDLADPSPRFQEFRRRYLEFFREEPSFGAAFAYEAVLVAARVLDREPGLDFEALQERLSTLAPFEGLSGTVELDAWGDNQRPFQIYEVREGAFRLVQN